MPKFLAVITPTAAELAGALEGAACQMVPAIRTSGGCPAFRYSPIMGLTGVDRTGGFVRSGWIYSRQRATYLEDLPAACMAAGEDLYAKAERQYGTAYRFTLISQAGTATVRHGAGTVYATEAATRVDLPRQVGRLLQAALVASGASSDHHALTHEQITCEDDWKVLSAHGFCIAGAPARCDFYQSEASA